MADNKFAQQLAKNLIRFSDSRFAHELVLHFVCDGIEKKP
jgi:hypothetical protein